MHAMSVRSRLSLGFARLRWKLYKASMRVCLGAVAGYGLDRNMIYGIFGSLYDPEIKKHLIEMQLLEHALVEQFAYPKSFPPAFSRNLPVGDRYAYTLKSVAISVETGAMWIPDGCVFIESLGNNVHFYAWGGLIDVLRRPKRVACHCPVVPCANLGYYHWLLDSLGQIVLADRLCKGKFRIAVSRRAARYVKSGLEFLGYPQSEWLVCDGPVLVDETILISRNADLGLIPRANLRVLREAIRGRIATSAPPTRKIYISRRLERNRAIENEADVERTVEKFGFEICYFERMSFEEQMRTIAESSVVMGVHGAGLSNIIAGTDGLRVIELMNPTWFNPCFSRLALQLGFDYRYLMMARTGSSVSAVVSDIEELLSHA